ncbi:MAG: hypothetical protein R3F62_29135 [Planctomycetota bacterium]
MPGRNRVGHCAGCGERLDPRDTSSCMRYGCDASYHRRCASGTRCVGCGYLLGEFHAPWPTTLLLFAGLYTLGSSLVVYTTFPVVHQLSTRALLLLGAFGPLAVALGIYAWTRERYRNHSVAINGPLALGNVLLAVTVIAGCSGMAFFRKGQSGMGSVLLGVAALGFVFRRLFHAETGRYY